jgi:hypothetical protein
LPVLEDVAAEVRRQDVVQPGNRIAAVLELLGVERTLTRKRLTGQRRREEDAEEDGQPVLEQETPHATCVLPVDCRRQTVAGAQWAGLGPRAFSRLGR